MPSKSAPAQKNKKSNAAKTAKSTTKKSQSPTKAKATSGDLFKDYQRYLTFTFGRHQENCPQHYRFLALSYAIRDRIMELWNNTTEAYAENTKVRRTYYLSLEFLMGRTLSNAILNLGLDKEVDTVCKKIGIDKSDIFNEEPDAALGNGGLGRLAACFLDSCATLQLPVTGYGLHYEYGMFRQHIKNGYQVEHPDHWLIHAYPWEIERSEYTQEIKFGGHCEYNYDDEGNLQVRWVNTNDILAIAYDVPIPGYNNGTVNTLRLWKAAATEVFNLHEFNDGDYAAAVTAKNQADAISMVLYPNDKSESGKELRLRQQYMLASASLQDVLRRWLRDHDSFDKFPESNCFQLNDTHPTIAIAELMRLLIDVHHLNWDDAWNITTKTMAYTNHTLLPEALERWSVGLMKNLLPRLMDIIYEINARFVKMLRLKFPNELDRISRMSIIEDGQHPQVRMAHLGIVGSFSVNGVAQLHSDLLCDGLFKDFYQLWPERFNNKTNGVTQRRWLAGCNPELRALLDKKIGTEWVTQLSQMRGLEKFIDDKKFGKEWQAVKQANKNRLADLIQRECGITLNTDAMFDVQVKRIHEYKRQLLNVLHVIHLYDRIKRGDTKNWTNRAVIIGGKAAPGYRAAKNIIKLINNVAAVVNSDPDVGDKLKLVFIPNYRVSIAETIFPGTDLSEQISTAGKEASGTGNMKFMINGALTIGTLDGANIEMREEVGKDWFFLFGMNAQEVEESRASYNPRQAIHADADLDRVIDLLRTGHFNAFEPGIFDDIIAYLTDWGDYWMVCADFTSYKEAQKIAGERFQDKAWWTEASIRNSAASGKFSTDRTMQDYNNDIWKLKSVKPA